MKTQTKLTQEPEFFAYDGWTADQSGVFDEDGNRITVALGPLSAVALEMFKRGFDMGFRRGEKAGAHLKSLEICRALNVQPIQPED